MSELASSLSSGLVEFLNASPSPFHAVGSCAKILSESGFTRISERDLWHGEGQNVNLVKGGKYFFTRNSSCLVAFSVGGNYTPGNGFQVIGAHTDSPDFKVRPISKDSNMGIQQVGVAPYGGGLWHTWFDRDLTVAGRVFLKVPGQGDEKVVQQLVHITRPILRIPNLAIHLQRGIYEKGFSPNTESEVQPYLATAIKAALVDGEVASSSLTEKHHPLLLLLLAEQLLEDGDLPVELASCSASELVSHIVNFELDVCDTQPATIGGAMKEFIFGPRLDNLLSCFLAVKALTSPEVAEHLPSSSSVHVVSLFDNEEVGSVSCAGAASSLLKDFFERFSECAPLMEEGSPTRVDTAASVAKSFVLSVDMAHAVHANYSSVHQKLHCPKIHDGVVIKTNCNQRYATTPATSLVLKMIAEKRGIPLQEFAVRSDMGCGSTIGPVLSSNTSVRTIDIGVPQLSMHSIREMCGVDDLEHMYNLLMSFLVDFEQVDSCMPFE